VTESGKPQGGGNLKYILGGLLLLGGAAVVVFMLRPASQPDETAERAPTPPKNAERVNPMAQPELILDEAPDAGKPAEEQVAAKEKPKQQAKEVRDEWDCDGDLSRESLQAVIDKNRAQVRNCYEKRLKVNNVLQGDLKLKLKIGSNGQVAALAVNGSLHDNEVFGCVRSVAQRWSFTPPTEGKCAVVQVPFQFAPKSN
jgi:outer membrane biosynthesis protein TonB